MKVYEPNKYLLDDPNMDRKMVQSPMHSSFFQSAHISGMPTPQSSKNTTPCTKE